MALAKIKSDEETLIEFDIQVYGTTDELSQVRFIIEGEKYDLVCRCSKTDNGGVEVTVPRLKGLFESGEYKCRLETIINDRIFTPLNESLEILPLVEINVKPSKIEQQTTPRVKVSSATAKKKINTQVSLSGKSLDEAKEQGAVVEYHNGANFLRMDGKFVGLIVNENKIIYTDSPCDTVEQIVECIEKMI